jgi:hypothetical protein
LDLGSLPTAIPWYLQAKQPFRFVSGTQLLNEIEEATGEQLMVSIKQQELVVDNARLALSDAQSDTTDISSLKRHLAESEIVLSSLHESYAKWQKGEALEDTVDSDLSCSVGDLSSTIDTELSASSSASSLLMLDDSSSPVASPSPSPPPPTQATPTLKSTWTSSSSSSSSSSSTSTQQAKQTWAKPQWSAGQARIRPNTPQRTFLERKVVECQSCSTHKHTLTLSLCILNERIW